MYCSIRGERIMSPYLPIALYLLTPPVPAEVSEKFRDIET